MAGVVVPGPMPKPRAMKLVRQDKLPVDCIPEEVSVFSQDFWTMRRIADDIRWDFGNVVVNIGVFEDFTRAYWFRVTMEPHPELPEIVYRTDTEHRDHNMLVRMRAFAWGTKAVDLGERCQWPRYKTIDVPVSYYEYESGFAEFVVSNYELAELLKRGGLE